MSYITRKEIENHFYEGVLGKPILTERQLLEVDNLISDWSIKDEFLKAGISLGPYIIKSKYCGKNLEEVMKYIGFHTQLPLLRLDINSINEFEEDIGSLLQYLFTGEGQGIPIWRSKYLVHIICDRYNSCLLADAVHKIARNNPENLVILSGDFMEEMYPYEVLDLKVKKEEEEELKEAINDNLRKAGLTNLESLDGDKDLEWLIEGLDQVKVKLIRNELLRSNKA